MANDGKICISICAKTAGELYEKIARAEPLADVIELRFDHLEPAEIDNVLATLPKIDKQYLLTYRPKGHGGAREIPYEARRDLWSRAIDKLAAHDILIDLESDTDFPVAIPPERIIASIHNFGDGTADLTAQYDQLARLNAATAKLAVMARSVTDAIPLWKLLKTSDKRMIPIAMGEAGKWTRILGLAHGAFMTYASLEAGNETAPGQISAADLADVFRVKELDADTEVYGVIAGDTSYSISPWMHNAAFRAAAMNRVFVPLQVSDAGEFIRRMVRSETREVELNFRGFSVTNPHKQAVIKHLDEVDETAAAIGAVNTVKIEGGRLLGYNTDAAGFIAPLKRNFGDLRNTRAAVVGAGGAARAVIYALKREGADVTVLARDTAKASALADQFAITARKLKPGDGQFAADIVVNTTPLGTRGENEDSSIATSDQLAGVKLLYDLVYNPTDTRLLREAKAAGVAAIGGMDMLIEQGAEQFRIWTEEQPPIAAMVSAVRKKLGS